MEQQHNRIAQEWCDEETRRVQAFYATHRYYNNMDCQERESLIREMATAPQDRCIPFDLCSYRRYAVLITGIDDKLECVAEVFTGRLQGQNGVWQEEVIACCPDLKVIDELLNPRECHLVEYVSVSGSPMQRDINMGRMGCLAFRKYLRSLTVSPWLNRFEFVDTEELFYQWKVGEGLLESDTTTTDGGAA